MDALVPSWQTPLFRHEIMTPAPEGGKVFTESKRKQFQQMQFNEMKNFALDLPGLISRDDILYLINRLEAAEALIGLESGINFRRLYARWLQASGKPQEGK